MHITFFTGCKSKLSPLEKHGSTSVDNVSSGWQSTLSPRKNAILIYCHPWESTVYRGFASVYNVSPGWQSTMSYSKECVTYIIRYNNNNNGYHACFFFCYWTLIGILSQIKYCRKRNAKQNNIEMGLSKIKKGEKLENKSQNGKRKNNDSADTRP